MSTLRQDVTTSTWVILAPTRAARPHRPPARARPAVPSRDPACPFCPGNEDQTPPEIARTGAGGEGWQQRVFPNLYAALAAPGSTERREENGFREMHGVGSHEVVVESRGHDSRLDQQPAVEIASVIGLWRERYLRLMREPWAKAVVVFKNFGETAGTSLVHPHSQIVATPVFPPDSLRRFAVATRYYDDTGNCVYDDLRDAELASGERIVARRDGFVALTPFAGSVPFETWIMPTEHSASFGRLDDAAIPDLAAMLGDVLAALRLAAGDPDFNLVVRSAPVHEEEKPYFLWHLQVLPRIATAAGFELGSGMSINTVAPEDSALALREALAERAAAG
ncbi:MAG TPA: galactose-1-phosphate uridylyltransferase [Actinomycetota bacterium]